MKKLLLFFFSIAALVCHAEKVLCVVIYDTEGRTAFSLQQRPVVSFTETDVKLSCNQTEVLYSLDNYLKLTIEETDTETTIEKVGHDNFIINSKEISAHGVESMALYTIDGKLITSGKADNEGKITIPVSQLKSGIYIVNTSNKSFKFIKK